jgi:hypothetical protein
MPDVGYIFTQQDRDRRWRLYQRTPHGAILAEGHEQRKFTSYSKALTFIDRLPEWDIREAWERQGKPDKIVVSEEQCLAYHLYVWKGLERLGQTEGKDFSGWEMSTFEGATLTDENGRPWRP